MPGYLSKMLKEERIEVAKNLVGKAECRTTGSLALDWAMGGGFPVGQLVTLWGPPGVGKTLMVLKALAQEQKKFPDKFAIWIDTEYSFDAERAREIGVDLERLIVLSSNTFEGAVAPLGKIEEDIKKNDNICAIILDSIKGLQPINAQGQMEKGAVDSAANAYGGIAKCINPALHILVRIANERGILTLLTNHANMNMDTRTAKYKPYTLTGGQLLKHLCSTVVLLDKPEAKKYTRISASLDGSGQEIKVGSLIRCTVNKSRNTVEGKRAEYIQNLESGEIEEKEEELIRLAKGLGVIWEDGQYLNFGEPSLGIRGRWTTGFKELLKKDENLFNKIHTACKETKKMSAIEYDSEAVIDIPDDGEGSSGN